MKKPIKRALVIHSLCSVGKASLSNIVPIMSIRGIEVCQIPSVILSSHTGGFKNIAKLDSGDFIKEGTKSLGENGIDFDLTLIGYLGSIDKINESIEYLKNENPGKVIVDTIFGDSGKLYRGFNKEYVEKIKELIKFSDIITPNLTEALYLTGREDINIDDVKEEDIKDIIYDLRKIGAKDIVITSVPCNNVGLGVAILEKDTFTLVCHEKLSKSYPGTGDIFTGVIATEILNNKSLKEGVIFASNFVKECIRYSMEYDYPTKEGVLLEKKLYKLI